MALVTAVIPTRNRPAMVVRAVSSVLTQTECDLEVIVVIDGEDPATELALSEISDSRLRVILLQSSVGGSETRNVGAREAKGQWVAYLDDDDEWFPEKIERQLEAARSSRHAFPVISNKLIARSPKADYIWPRLEPWLPIGDYLMRRREWFKGEGVLQTSTLMAPRELLMRCSFTEGLRKHQDWDWLIRALEVPGTGLEFVPSVLTVWYIDENRPGIGAKEDWRYSLAWGDSIRPLITPEAYASFVLTFLGASAAFQGDWRAIYTLLRSAFQHGKPRLIHLMLFASMWLTPQKLRRLVRRLRYA